MWRVHDGMGWWMVFSGLLWLAFWVLIVYVIMSLVSRARSAGQPTPPEVPDPLDIVRRRYAAGEITRDEFERIRDDLGAAHRDVTVDEAVSGRR